MNKIAVDMFFQLFAATSYIYKPQNYKKIFFGFCKTERVSPIFKKRILVLANILWNCLYKTALSYKETGLTIKDGYSKTFLRRCPLTSYCRETLIQYSLYEKKNPSLKKMPLFSALALEFMLPEIMFPDSFTRKVQTLLCFIDETIKLESAARLTLIVSV